MEHMRLWTAGLVWAARWDIGFDQCRRHNDLFVPELGSPEYNYTSSNLQCNRCFRVDGHVTRVWYTFFFSFKTVYGIYCVVGGWMPIQRLGKMIEIWKGSSKSKIGTMTVPTVWFAADHGDKLGYSSSRDLHSHIALGIFKEGGIASFCSLVCCSTTELSIQET
jgi:hypothetical protein